MYLSLSDRPATQTRQTAPTAHPRSRGGRSPVARLVVTLGLVSLLTDISSESVSAILPLYLTSVLVAGALVVAVTSGTVALRGRP